MLTGLVNFFANLALAPEAPAPVLPYSAKSTLSIFSLPFCQTDQPTEFTTEPSLQFWKTTRAKLRHGRPKYVLPAPAVPSILHLFRTKYDGFEAESRPFASCQ
jgi:hypothetical protein